MPSHPKPEPMYRIPGDPTLYSRERVRNSIRWIRIRNQARIESGRPFELEPATLKTLGLVRVKEVA